VPCVFIVLHFFSLLVSLSLRGCAQCNGSIHIYTHIFAHACIQISTIMRKCFVHLHLCMCFFLSVSLALRRWAHLACSNVSIYIYTHTHTCMCIHICTPTPLCTGISCNNVFVFIYFGLSLSLSQGLILLGPKQWDCSFSSALCAR